MRYILDRGFMDSTERRRAERFHLNLSCRVSFPMRETGEVEATTEDVSRLGMAVTFEDAGVDGSLGVGEIAHITMRLPHTPQLSPRFLACDGKVVRVGPAPNGQQAIAFSVRRMRFCDQAELEDPLDEAVEGPQATGYIQ